MLGDLATKHWELLANNILGGETTFAIGYDDFSVELAEAAEYGFYETSLTMPRPGIWKLVLRITRGEDVHEIRATTAVSSRE